MNYMPDTCLKVVRFVLCDTGNRIVDKECKCSFDVIFAKKVCYIQNAHVVWYVHVSVNCFAVSEL